MIKNKLNFLRILSSVLLISFVFNIALTNSVFALTKAQKSLIDNGIYYYDPDSASNDCSIASTTMSNNKVYIVGDSYSDGLKQYITPKLTEMGYEVAGYNGHTGRSISSGGNEPGSQSGMEAIKQDADAIKSAGNILIILGTNGPTGYENDIPLFMKEINSYNSGARKFWVNTNNVKVSQKDIATANASILKFSTEFNYSVVDWFAATSPNLSSYIGPDNLHPSVGGYKLMTDLISTAFGQSSADSTNRSSSTSTGTIKTAKTPEGNAVQIWAYLIGKGFTPNQAAGIMGNLQAESGFMPDRVQNRTVENGSVSFDPSWLNNLGYGLAQWTSGGRQKNLLDFAKKRGVQDSDLLMQLDFLLGELESPSYKKVLDDIKKSTTLSDATLPFLINFEAPKSKNTTETQNTRTRLAAQVLQKYGGISGVTVGCSKSVGGKGGYDIGSMVFYSQIDPKWKTAKYDECTIGEGGCGPTSMAMVVATLVDPSITPVDIANYFAEIDNDGQCGTGWGVWDKVAAKYGLKYQDLSQDFTGANEVLNNGGLVVGSFGDDSFATEFTSGKHLMVIRKVDTDGTYYIADPIQTSKSADKNNKGYSQSNLIERSGSGGALNHMWGFTRE